MAELVPQTTELQLWILWSPDISPQCGVFAVWLVSLQQAVFTHLEGRGAGAKHETAWLML